MKSSDSADDIAARIADGSAIDWTSTAKAVTADDRALLDELKAIDQVASLHRAPADDGSGDSEPGRTQWGPLQILSTIGSGRFGTVYVAWEPRLRRRVALKLLHGSSSSLARPTRAIDEARLLARVRHPNVLTVFGAEYLDDRVGIWTELIEGQTLDALVAERGPLPARDVIDIGIDLCRALTAVHRAGLLHRDIKPQNVMRETGGRIVLMDFGASHDLALGPTRDSDLTGTPLYLAPEVLDGKAASAASDVYALGVLLFHLLTGTHPAAGRTLDEVRSAHAPARRRSLRDFRPDLPKPLLDVVDRAVAHDPARRYESAAALADALEPVRARATEPATITTRRRRLSAALAIVTAASIVAFLWIPRATGLPSGLGEPRRPPAAVVTSATATRLDALRAFPMVGRPSRDGRMLPVIDPSGNVLLWSTGDASTHRVTSLAAGESALYPLASPDGSLVAYDVAGELRMTTADGSATRVVIPAGLGLTVETLEWSVDGASILCAVQADDGRTHLTVAYAAGGSSVLQTLTGNRPRNASLSPDGRFLVYDRPTADDPARREIVIAAADHGTPAVLVGGSGHNFMPLWTPDGSGVFFLSDRDGAMNGWVVRMVNDAAAGSPQRVAWNLGLAVPYPYAFTNDGRLFFGLRANDLDIYTVDVEAGRALPESRTRLASTPATGHLGPGWSPRGDVVSYLTASWQTALDRDSQILTIQDLPSGARRYLPVTVNRIGALAPRWSPDGRQIALRGEGLDSRIGYFIVNPSTGDASTVHAWPEAQTSEYGAFAWAPDGRGLAYFHQPRGLVLHDLVTRQEVVLAEPTTRIPMWSVVFSPDGAQMAFTSRDRGTRAMVIEVAHVDGRNRQVLLNLPSQAAAVLQGWSTDGRLVYTLAAMNSDLPPRLWNVPASGREPPRDMGLSIDADTRVNRMALSPDGRKIAFTEGGVSREVWVIDGVVPRR